MEKLFLFDIDGTLLRSGGAGKRSFNKAFYELYGIKDGFKDVDMHGMLDPIIFSNALKYHGLNGNNRFEEFKKLYVNFLKRESFQPSGWYLIEGVKDFLEKFKNKVHFTLLTGNILKGALLKLNTLKLLNYFPDAEIGAFGEDAHERKLLGKCALLKIKEKYGFEFSPEDIYVFGDTPHDIEVAKFIKAKSVALTSGGISFDRLAEFEPDILANNFREIINFDFA